MNLQCPNCGRPFNAVVETVIDASQDPQVKARLLSGQLNTVRCPNCGNGVTVAAPLLYHDASKELLIAFIPMELNLTKDQQEKAIGDLMRDLKLPQQAMKAYVFQPRRALTMQGVIEQVLQADGVTPEMMEQQKARVRLIETLMQTPPEQLASVVQQNDAQVDAQFFQTVTMMAQRILAEGRSDVAEALMQMQQIVAGMSTFGQQMIERSRVQEGIVAEVSEELEQFAENATRDDFLNMALRYADDDQHLQALVGLARPAFDYTFFQELSVKIGQAPSEARDALIVLRDKLLELTAIIDQQTQAALREAAELLQELISAPNLDQAIAENIPLLDDTFMAVLSANVQEAERRGDLNASAKLKLVYERVVDVLRDNMQPELRFINDLLSTASDEDARALLLEQADTYGPVLLDMMDAVERVLAEQGDTAMVQKLIFLREQAGQVLG
ncbi:MAG: CpXC domain-containing protein [Chloroflexota bacterium]